MYSYCSSISTKCLNSDLGLRETKKPNIYTTYRMWIFLQSSTIPLMSKKSQIGFKSVHDAIPIHLPCTNRHQAARHIKLLHCFHGCTNDEMMEKNYSCPNTASRNIFYSVPLNLSDCNKHQLIYTLFIQGGWIWQWWHSHVYIEFKLYGFG